MCLLVLVDEIVVLFVGDQVYGVLWVGVLDVVLVNYLLQCLVCYCCELLGVELYICLEYLLLFECLLMEGELDLIVIDGFIEYLLLVSCLVFCECLLWVIFVDLLVFIFEDFVSFEFYVFGYICYYCCQVDCWLVESGIQLCVILEIEFYLSFFVCIEVGFGFVCVLESFVVCMFFM